VTDAGRAAELRARFEGEQGHWDERWQSVLDADPELFAACVDLAGVPWREGEPAPVGKLARREQGAA
jgi:hypothetical protein